MKTIIATLFVLSSALSFAQSKINNNFCVYKISTDSSESIATKKRTATINELLSNAELKVCSAIQTAELKHEIVSFRLSIWYRGTKTIFEFNETLGSRLTEEQLSLIRKLDLKDEIYVDDIKVNINGSIEEKYYSIRISII